MAEKETASPEERLDSAATWLVGSFGTVTTLLAALGAVNGGIERMLRNHQGKSSSAFVLLAAAISFGVLAKVLFTPPARLRWLLGKDWQASG